MKKNREKGFTFVEISIVMLIIAVIMVGVFAGREMLKMAEIRALAAKMENIEKARFTFHDKYDCTPGDCRVANMFGLGVDGDGDGVVTDQNAGRLGARFQNEIVNYWLHLQNSTIYSTDLTDGTPPISLNNAHITVMYEDAYKKNYYVLGANPAANRPNEIFNLRFIPEQLQGVDNKMDDGLPRAGKFVAYQNASIRPADGRFNPVALVDGQCVNTSDNPESYAITAAARTCTAMVEFAGTDPSPPIPTPPPPITMPGGPMMP